MSVNFHNSWIFETDSTPEMSVMNKPSLPPMADDIVLHAETFS